MIYTSPMSKYFLTAEVKPIKYYRLEFFKNFAPNLRFSTTQFKL